MDQKKCEHKYIHFDTHKRKEDRVFGVPSWTRIDVFFCEKCLDEQKKYKNECSWERPEWY